MQLSHLSVLISKSENKDDNDNIGLKRLLCGSKCLTYVKHLEISPGRGAWVA